MVAAAIGCTVADAPALARAPRRPPSWRSGGKRCGQRLDQHSTTASNERPGGQGAGGGGLCGGVTGDVARGRDVALYVALDVAPRVPAAAYAFFCSGEGQ